MVNQESGNPIAVIEVKASATQISEANADATHYGDLCVQAGYAPLAIALAGASEDDFKVRVLQWGEGAWRSITYDSEPINWIPNKADVERLTTPGAPREIRPSVPPAAVLASRGDEINRLLRESGIKDEFRPAVG